jgi:hypothetical protein
MDPMTSLERIRMLQWLYSELFRMLIRRLAARNEFPRNRCVNYGIYNSINDQKALIKSLAGHRPWTVNTNHLTPGFLFYRLQSGQVWQKNLICDSLEFPDNR